MDIKKHTTFLVVLLCFCVSFNLFSKNNVSVALNYSLSKPNMHHIGDSLYQVTLKLNKDLELAKANHNNLLLANTHNNLGNIFSKMGAYSIAKKNYTKAFTLYDSLKKTEKIDAVLTNLAKSSLEDKNYTCFDSIIPIALAYSKKINSVNAIINLNFITVRNHHLQNNEASIKYADEGLKTIALYEGKHPIKTSAFTSFKEIFKYYKAVALIKLGKYTEGYELLFKVNEYFLFNRQDIQDIPYTKMATLNYYKYLYYTSIDKNVKKAVKFLLKSDTYKHKAFKHLEHEKNTNVDLITQVLETEKQLKLTEELRKKDLKISNAFYIATMFLVLLILVLTGSTFYFYKNRKHIKSINQELKKTNTKLINADKERMEFFSILSHELRTPVYGISGLANLLQDENSEEKKEYYLEALLASSNYIAVLIDNVLQATKFKFEIKTLKPTPNNLFELVANITDNIKMSAKNKGLKFITKINISRNDTLLIDKIAFSQILINLVYNAIRYTKKGHVALYITEKQRTDTDATFFFEIRDTGKGIEEKYRSVIFNAFENNAFINKNSKGSGLGLYIVKTLLNLHNSDIDFRSKPNEGSTFFFTTSFKFHKAKASTKNLVLQNNTYTYKILIVDDNKINLLITKKNIEKIPNCISVTCNSGYKAVALAKQEHFDLILMDINMPGMDGFEASKQIRTYNTSVPIAALTALNSSETSLKANACNIDHVITKPYVFSDFQDIILTLLGVYKKQSVPL